MKRITTAVFIFLTFLFSVLPFQASAVTFVPANGSSELSNMYLGEGYAQVDTEAELAAAITAVTPRILARVDITFTGPHTLAAGQVYAAIPGAVVTTAGNTFDLSAGHLEDNGGQMFDAGDGEILLPDVCVEVHPYWWGITGTNDEIAINKAMTAAEPTVKAISPVDSQWDYSDSGKVVIMAPEYITSGTIEIPAHVTVRGTGPRGSVITSDYDGQVVRSKLTTSMYNYTGIRIENIKIWGDKTKANQVGLDLLRMDEGKISTVTVENCGSHGIILRECIGSEIEASSKGNGGDGILITEGINSWTDPTNDNYPSNGNRIRGYFSRNDGAGIHIYDSNGNVVSGVSEYNYFASGDNVGYNVLFDGSNGSYNTIENMWTEGWVQAHIYHDSPNGNNRAVNCHFISNGATGKVDRAVISAQGKMIIENPIMQQSPFKTINSSNSPFRVVKATTGKIILVGGHIYLSPTTGSFENAVEDENGNHTGLENYATVWSSNSGTWYGLGGEYRYMTTGSIANRWYGGTGGAWDAQPFMQIDNTFGLQMGAGGATALDVGIKRVAANVLGLASGDGLGVGNSVANTNTPSGATARAVPIYDESGTLLGYIPVYAVQW